MPKKERRERTTELLEAFSLTEKRNDRTRTLSGGMKRRLILARALMHRPRLLILDEPTAGVDVELRLELWHYVQRINAEGTTILLTTHYLEEAEQLCDQIAFINDGEIVARGTSPELADAVRRVAASRTPTSSSSAARSSRAPTSRTEARMSRAPDPLPRARAPRGQPLLEDQAPDARRAAARDVPLHLRVRRRARLAHRQAARRRLRRLHRPRPDHDGLGDERVLQQLVVDPPAEVPARDRRPALVAGVAGRAAARLLARRLPARHGRRDRSRSSPRRSSSTSRSSTPLVLLPALLLVGFFFAQLGVLVGVRAEQFDDVSFYQTFVLQPLIFLGGVFYSATLLPAAVRDADAVRPRLLHDRARPLRVPRLLARRTSPLLAAAPDRRRRPRSSRSTTACSRAATACGSDRGPRSVRRRSGMRPTTDGRPTRWADTVA